MQILPGAPIYIYNLSDGLLFGIFECVGTMELNMDPSLFSKVGNATTSPFPVQIKVRISIEAPPLDSTDIILRQILRDRGGIPKVGPLSFSQCKVLADLITERSGALAFMQQRKKVLEGKVKGNVQELKEGMDIPISIPPEDVLNGKATERGGGEKGGGGETMDLR